MATTTLNTRIKLKYDTLENWTSNNPVLLAGEVAITTVPSATGSVVSVPATLMKVGDDATAYNDLPFLSAAAADVHDWAKAESKPVYAASDITGLEAFIGSNDTNTTYRISHADGAREFTLQKQEKGSATWTDVSTVAIPETVYTLVTGTANGTVKFNGADVAVKGLGTAAYKAESDFATPASVTAVADDLAGVVTDVNTLKGTGTGSVTKTVNDAIAALDLANTYDAKNAAATVQSDLNAYKTSNNTAVGTAQSAADDAQADVDALTSKVGTVPDDKTVVQMIADAKADASYDDTALKGRVTTVEGKVTTLEGSVATLNGSASTVGSVAKALADAKAYADGLADDYDAAGDAAQALADAKAYANGLANNYDAAGDADQALADAKAYADGLAGNYDGAGAAAQALVAAKAYADTAETDAITSAKTYTDAEIAAKIASTYKAAGSVAFESLGALAAANEGKVYNVSDAFTTTADFIEGAGSTYPAGTNVVIIKVDSSYKYDVLAGMTDLSAYSTTTQVEGLISTAKSEAIAAAATDATTKADAALASAKDYADGLASNYDEAGDADAALAAAKSYTDSEIETLEGTLADVATTGDIADLTQASGEYVIFDCGSSTTVI